MSRCFNITQLSDINFIVQIRIRIGCILMLAGTVKDWKLDNNACRNS